MILQDMLVCLASFFDMNDFGFLGYHGRTVLVSLAVLNGWPRRRQESAIEKVLLLVGGGGVGGGEGGAHK